MDKDLIGKVCWFWNDNSKTKRLGILKKYNGGYLYGKYYESYNDGFDSYRYCQAVNSNEINFKKEN